MAAEMNTLASRYGQIAGKVSHTWPAERNRMFMRAFRCTLPGRQQRCRRDRRSYRMALVRQDGSLPGWTDTVQVLPAGDAVQRSPGQARLLEPGPDSKDPAAPASAALRLRRVTTTSLQSVGRPDSEYGGAG